MFGVLAVRLMIILGVISCAVTAGKRWSRRVRVLRMIGGGRRWGGVRIRGRVWKLRRRLVMIIGIVVSRLHLL